MREVIGDLTVDDVITIGRQDIEIAALGRMQELAKRYGIGIRVDQVQLSNVNPPAEVQASFNEVNKAQQDRENAINIANGDYNEAVPRARGQADQMIRAAEGYRFKRVNEAEGDVASFNAILIEYVKAPEITRTRLYLETMGDVLPATGEKIIRRRFDPKVAADSSAQRRIPREEMNKRGCLWITFIGLVSWLLQLDSALSTRFTRPSRSSSLSSVNRSATQSPSRGFISSSPLIQEFNRIDKRFCEWGGSPIAIPTRDKTYIHVDISLAGASRIRRPISFGSATSAAPNRVWKTFSEARRAMPWPNMI